MTIIADILQKGKVVTNYLVDATSTWDSTTSQVTTVPTGKRWFFITGHVFLDANATLTVNLRDTANNPIQRLSYYAAGTGYKQIPESGYVDLPSVVPIPAGWDFQITCGAAQGAGAHIGIMVVEVDE